MRIFVNFRPEITACGSVQQFCSLFLASKVFDQVITSSDRQTSSVEYAAEVVSIIANCDAFIAIIGRDWDELREGPNRLIDDPLDPIRVEIVAALDRIMPMVPVLVDGATLPGPAEIAAALQGLTLREPIAINLRDLERDFPRLISVLAPALSETLFNAVETSRSKKKPQTRPEQKSSAAVKDVNITTADLKTRFWWMRRAAAKEKRRANAGTHSSTLSSEMDDASRKPNVDIARSKPLGPVKHDITYSGPTAEGVGDLASPISNARSEDSKSNSTPVKARQPLKLNLVSDIAVILVISLIILSGWLFFTTMSDQLAHVWQFYRVSI